jgi:hypothetical protein
MYDPRMTATLDVLTMAGLQGFRVSDDVINPKIDITLVLGPSTNRSDDNLRISCRGARTCGLDNCIMNSEVKR